MLSLFSLFAHIMRLLRRAKLILLTYFSESFPVTLLFILTGIIGGFIAGLGGPGGLPVIGLFYSHTGLSTAGMAGTTSSIFFFATVFASSMYYYSGDVNWKLVLPLIPATLIGTAAGARLNFLLSRQVFGIFVSLLVMVIGAAIVFREYKGLKPVIEVDYTTREGKAVISIIGLAVGIVGGAFGVGGPALSIPLLIFTGVPALQAIGAGLVQGIFVTSSTAINYIFRGEIAVDLVLLVGFPYLFSQIAGWYLAQNIQTRSLKIALGGMLVLLGPYLLVSI